MFKQELNKWTAWSWIIIALTLISAVYYYNLLPPSVVTHWDFSGQPNGSSSRGFAAWFFPGLLIILILLFHWLPKIDPRRANYLKFKSAYQLFIFVLILFLGAIYQVMNLVNLGIKLDVGQVVLFLVGLLLIFIGSILDQVKSNWFIGVRTPWTLSSESVWQQTHIFAKKVFIIAGLVLLVTPFLGLNFRPFVFGVVIVFLLMPIVYSYFLFKKEK